MKIALIRHGKTKGNLEKRFIGTTDEPLSQLGKNELNNLIGQNIYPSIKKVYSSPLKRTMETANLLYPSEPPEILKDIREMDFGDFENKTFEEITANSKYSDFGTSEECMYFPNGENLLEFKKRCITTFENVVKKDEDSIIICHGGCIMAIMEKYGLPKGNFYNWISENGRGFLITIDKNLNTEKNEKI